MTATRLPPGDTPGRRGTPPTLGRDIEADGPAPERWRTVVTVVLLALPVVATFWFIHRYALNIVFADQWHDIQLIGRFRSGTLGFSDLWAQHGENRILVPNLVVLLLAHTVRFNVVDEDYLSGLLLVASTALFAVTHHRGSPRTPWLYYLPVAVGLLSLNQGGMTLFGFAMSWYLEIFALAVAVFLLDRPILRWPVVTGAVLIAAVGSFSSLEGLLIWPVGLFVIWFRRQSRTSGIVWSVSALAVTSIYFYNLNTAQVPVDRAYPLHHPLLAVRFFLFAIGNVLGVPIPHTPTGGDYALLAVGAVIFVVAVGILVHELPRRGPVSSCVGVAMILYGLLYTVLLTVGRAPSGPVVLPRYAIFDLVMLVGCYLAVLDGVRSAVRRRRLTPIPVGEAPLPGDSPRTGGTGWRRGFVAGLVGLAAVMGLQLVVGIHEALEAGETWHQQELAIGDVTVNIRQAPDAVISRHLASAYETPSFIRRMAGVARQDRLSLFATGAVVDYAREGLIVDQGPPVSTVIIPSNGAVVRGEQVLYATASAPYGVTRVDYLVTGGTLHAGVIGAARPGFYGWILRWDSGTVADGSYLLQSEAFDSRGDRGLSPGVRLVVRN